jgi:hypothetical protein
MNAGVISKKLLRGLAGGQGPRPAPPPLEPRDLRSEHAAALLRVDEAEMEALGRVFAGTALMQDEQKLGAILTLRRQVAEAWSEARDAFLEIGRALNDVDRTLDQAERDALKRGFAQIFPFSETVASQFRKIAAAVDGGHLPLDACPGSYGAAYQLALLSPSEMERAKGLGLVRPDVPKAAVIAFRKQTQGDRPPEQLDLGRLRQELRRLEGEWRRDVDALRGKRLRMQRIRALLIGQLPGQGRERG